MQKGSSSVCLVVVCVCVCVHVCVWLEGVGWRLGFVDIYGAWQVEKGESKSRNIKKTFLFIPKRTWEIYFIFFQIYNWLSKLKHDKKTPIIKSEVII